MAIIPGVSRYLPPFPMTGPNIKRDPLCGIKPERLGSLFRLYRAILGGWEITHIRQDGDTYRVYVEKDFDATICGNTYILSPVGEDE